MCLGIPGQLVAITSAADNMAIVEVAGVRRPVNISFIRDDAPPESCIGEWVLVHVGFAMSRIDAEEAMRTLELLQELGELQAELDGAPTEAVAPDNAAANIRPST